MSVYHHPVMVKAHAWTCVMGTCVTVMAAPPANTAREVRKFSACVRLSVSLSATSTFIIEIVLMLTLNQIFPFRKKQNKKHFLKLDNTPEAKDPKPTIW